MTYVGGRLRGWIGGLRRAYLTVLLTYLCYEASVVMSIALLYFGKDTLRLTPAEAAGIALWLGLPWSMKMVVGVASDMRPIFGGRRAAYLLWARSGLSPGTPCSPPWYGPSPRISPRGSWSRSAT